MAKPLLLLDIDGVLAPFGGNYDETHRYVDISTHYGHTHIYLRHDLRDIVQRLLRKFSLMWGTAWEELANMYLLEHMGLHDPLPLVEFRGSVPGVEQRLSGLSYDGPMPETWKLPWIKHFLNQSDQAAVWIDDEVREDAHDYARSRTEEGKPTLFVRTDPSIGFIDDHLEELEDWADRLDTSQTDLLDSRELI